MASRLAERARDWARDMGRSESGLLATAMQSSVRLRHMLSALRLSFRSTMPVPGPAAILARVWASDAVASRAR